MGREEPSVSLTILIVNWNTKADLLTCLASLRESLTELSHEVLVIDNGSSDGSGEAVRREHPGVTLLNQQRNLGFGRAVNIGLLQRRGRYALLLNPDTRVCQGAIEQMLAFMETHPEAGVVGAQLLNEDGSKQNSIANFPTLATELLNKSLLRWFFPAKFPGKGKDYADPIEVESVIGACMLVRGEAIQRVGMLDEDYFLFLEETDWCYRMKKAGWKVYHVPWAEIVHFQGRSADAEKGKARLEYYRSRYQFFRKNRGRFQWALLRILLMLKLTAETAGMAAICLLTLFAVPAWRKRFSVFAYLLGWHLRGCPEGMGLKPV